MKKKRYSEKQILRILREAEISGASVEEFCRSKAISEQTFYRRRPKYEGISDGEAKRLSFVRVSLNFNGQRGVTWVITENTVG